MGQGDVPTAGTAAPGTAYREITKSPKPSSAEITTDNAAPSEYRQLYLNPRGNEVHGPFCTNVVITSKYTVWSFLPKFTVESFAKLANAYFLVVSALQCIPAISNTNGIPSSLPVLLFILAVDGTLAIIEDRRRHLADEEANSAKCNVVNRSTGALETILWSALQVGQIVKLDNRGTAPADLLILAVHEVDVDHKAGICYVETKSLDGETNLKLRQAMESTLEVQTEAEVSALHGRVECEQPNKAISRFAGSFFVDQHDGYIANDPISIKNILLRGCQLRNTEWMYGLVLNTGPDTKIMQSSAKPVAKWSSINGQVNRMIQWLLLLLVLLCSGSATAYVFWDNTFNAYACATAVPPTCYLSLETNSAVQRWFVGFGQYFLLMYQIIPVSLYVTISTVMFLQAIFMSWDLDMYFEELDVRMIVRTMGLNEELGQISYVFSDKTGTLTCNVMEFRKCSINGVSYGLGTTEIGRAALKRKGLPVPEVPVSKKGAKVPYVNFEDPRLHQKLTAIPLNSSTNWTKEAEFFLHLAICHTVIPEQATDKHGDAVLRYSASSPDEQALVSAAKFFGFAFESRGLGVARVRVTNKSLQQDPSASSELWEFKVLDVLEFNSDRKRMSCVVQDPNGAFMLLTKGADNVITPLLANDNDADVVAATLEQLQTFADDGLRTLTIAKKVIPTAYYHQWTKRYKAACASLDQIDKRKNGHPNDIDACMVEMEQDLVLLGATAIEDKLQDNVPRAIARLMEAGMKVWVLTGDKQETAINIAYACQLMDNDMMQYVFNLDEYPDLASLRASLALCVADLDQVEITRRSLVIDGDALEMVMADTDDACAMFLKVAMECASVVCCRVSPSQKAEVVGLVRANNVKARTLAIGDGANDVAMIQRAHVGVGICGMEGMQAVNSSDYAIGQFYFLEKLLLHHGRLNYVRMSKLVGYMFYKNIMMALAQYFYLYTTGSSGQKAYSEIAFQAYNLAFTSMPIVVLGVFDYDVPWAVGQRFPALYKPGITGELFNTTVFFKWIAASIFESAVIFIVTVYGYNQLEQGLGSGDLQQYGILLFALVVFVCNFKIIPMQQSWLVIGGVVWWLGVLSYIPLCLYLESSWYWLSSSDFGATQNTLDGGVFWLIIPVASGMCLLRFFSWVVFQRRFYPFLWQVVQEKYVLGQLESPPCRDVETGTRPVDDTFHEGAGGYLRHSHHSTSSSQSVSRRNSGFAFSSDPQSSMAEGIMITSTKDSRASAMKTAEGRIRVTRLEQRSSDYALTREAKQPSGYFI